MKLSWTPDLATGNEAIDGQHRAIIEKINGLMEACQAGRGKDSIIETLGFVEGHINTHFADEEALQVQNGYAGYDAHKAEHDNFRRDFTDLKAALLMQGPSSSLVVTTNRVLVDWLINHIRKDDKALADYLKVKQA